MILSSDSLNSSPRPWVLGLELQRHDPGDILAIPVASYDWAYVRDLTRLYRAWLGEHVGQLDELTLAASPAPSKPPSTSEAAEDKPLHQGQQERFTDQTARTGAHP